MTMNDRAWIATRKGLFELRRADQGWRIERISFLGEPVSMLLPPQDDGRMLAALNLGHFGVKLHASDDAGANWHEVATPAYPEQPADATGPPWKLVQVWSLEAAHGTVWAGTLPGGLFRSATSGSRGSWSNRCGARPERAEWFGGGYDVPGIHSICPHPRHAGEVLVGISCGGVWVSRDDGADWALQADGMRADYMPPEQADRPEHPGSASHRALPCRARGAVVPASQRHLALDRQRATLAGGGHCAGVELRLRASPSIPTSPARPGSCRRKPTNAVCRSMARWWSTAPAMAARSFETLRRGLPSAHCYDLVYRHGLALAPDGRSLLMGSTTGGLWAATTPAMHGGPCPRRCRRSTPCVSAESLGVTPVAAAARRWTVVCGSSRDIDVVRNAQTAPSSRGSHPFRG